MNGRFLIVEDEKAIRNGIAGQLKRRNYHVEQAATVAETRDIIKRTETPFHVVLLDVNLKDSKSTGLDLGLEMKKNWANDPPLFLVFSSFDKVYFYQKALDLGAEAYIPKPQDNAMMVACIRALTLKKIFQKQNLDQHRSIQGLVRVAKDKACLIHGLINHMKNSFETFLPCPSMFLISHRGGTLVESFDNPYHEFKDLDVHQLSALIYGRCNASPFHQIDSFDMEEHIQWGSPRVKHHLEGALFIPMVETPDLHIMMGLLPHHHENPLKDDLSQTAEALVRFFRYPFYEAVSHALNCWTANRERKKTTIEMTAQLCLYIGQEQLDLVESKNSNMPPKLGIKKLALELLESGGFLGSLIDDLETPHPKQEKQESTLRAEVERAWHAIRETYEISSDALQIQNDVHIYTHLDSLHLILTRVFQWAVQRMLVDTPEGKSPSLSVCCAEGKDHVELVIDENTKRIGAVAREYLFVPFCQPPLKPLEGERINAGLHFPLFLAKILAETRLGGSFDDYTEELTAPTGNRFVLSFPGKPEPPTSGTVANPDTNPIVNSHLYPKDLNRFNQN